MTKYEWIARFSFVVGHMNHREQDIARQSFEAGQKSVQATKLPSPPVCCNVNLKTIEELHLI